MTDRVNACLDGELPEERLTAGERLEVERIHAAAAELRAALPAAPAGLGERVLLRIRELGLEHAPPAPQRVAAPAGIIRRLLDAVWQPRQVAFGFRPAYGAALVVLAALLVVGRPGDGPAPAADAATPAVFVQFRLDADGASNVVLAGSFTDWAPRHELVETQPGVWTVVVALEPGVHEYAFLVDGEQWVVDPAAPSVEDGFGGHNSRLALLSAL